MTLAVAAAGLLLLVARPLVLGGPSAPILLGATSILILGASVSSPVAADPRARLSPPVVLAVGLAAVGLAPLVAGTPIPVRVGPTAIALNALAAVSEEAFFRRFLYGRLVRYGALAAVVVSAVCFALVHVPAYGPAVFWVDLGAGLLLSWQRWASGGWAAPAATHAVANLLVVLR